MSAWIVVALAGAGSYLFRISMLVVAAHAGVPAVIERSARFAVQIAFAALAATSLAGLVARTGTASVAPVLAVLVGVVVARRTDSSRAAIFVGMPTLWLLTALGG